MMPEKRKRWENVATRSLAVKEEQRGWMGDLHEEKVELEAKKKKEEEETAKGEKD